MNTYNGIYYSAGGGNGRYVTNAGVSTYFAFPYKSQIGKSSIVSYVHNGTNLSVYLNGILLTSFAAGSDITFTVNWSDPDSGDQTKIHICKTNNISEPDPTNNTGQDCFGGSWCDTTNWDTTSPSGCDYTTSDSDAGTNNYYAFVCDDEDSCSDYTSSTFTVEAVSTPSKIFKGGTHFK